MRNSQKIISDPSLNLLKAQHKEAFKTVGLPPSIVDAIENAWVSGYDCSEEIYGDKIVIALIAGLLSGMFLIGIGMMLYYPHV